MSEDKGAPITTANREEIKSYGGFDVLSRNTGGFDTSVASKQSKIKQVIIQGIFKLIEKIKSQMDKADLDSLPVREIPLTVPNHQFNMPNPALEQFFYNKLQE